MTRSSFAAVLVLAMSACKPDLPHSDPTPVAYAVFDPTTSQIPLPNDLAFAVDINASCGDSSIPAGSPPACAQAELLAAFAGKFPSDQEVAVTIDFVQNSYDASGKAIPGAPNLDVASLTPSTFAVIGTNSDGSGPIPIDPPTAADYVKAADGSKGTLTIHHQGHTPWPTGSYAVFIRGGDSGVKTTDGVPVGPSQGFDLIAQGLDMTDPKNIGLLKAQFGTTEAALAQGEQLNLVIALYKKSLFPAVDAVFPHNELAIATTFSIDVVQTNVAIDPGRGLAPLPFDLLRDSTGHISQLAACSFAGSTVAADGKSCTNAAVNGLAAGFTTLDGFSTTGAILGPTSDLIRAGTVTASTLMLYELKSTGAELVPAADLILEPCEFTSSCATPASALAPVIAIQPAGATASDGTSLFRSRPLKENTDYAVVMTNGILDKAGNPLASGTVAKILKFTNPVNVNGKSVLSGIDDTTTLGLEKMRLQLAPVFTALQGNSITKSKVAIAYTFHTQSILSTATQLAALPYSTPAATALPTNFAVAGSSDVGAPKTIADAFAKYGADALAATAPQIADIDEILETDITTFNLLDPASGAFNPDPTKAVPETIHVLISTPKVAPACAGGVGQCAPMMIFRHGITRGRADMLAIAEAYAKAGMVTVAIDSAKHGDRSYCTAGTTGTTKVNNTAVGGCNTGVACTAIPGMEHQGDVAPPGVCADGKLAKAGVTGADRTADQDGIAKISGNYLISANFFRTRDTMRQDLIDESQLIRAIAAVPPGTGNPVFSHMSGRGSSSTPRRSTTPASRSARSRASRTSLPTRGSPRRCSTSAAVPWSMCSPTRRRSRPPSTRCSPASGSTRRPTRRSTSSSSPSPRRCSTRPIRSTSRGTSPPTRCRTCSPIRLVRRRRRPRAC